MYKNAASLHTLVDQLLYVQKIGAGMVRLQLSEIDLVQLVCNVSEPVSADGRNQRLAI